MKCWQWFAKTFLWRRCDKHGLPFNSDFCPRCVKVMCVQLETHNHL